MDASIISRCEKLIRELANSIALKIIDSPFREAVKKKLKFSNNIDWNTLCSLMDVLDDTELAKENYLRYGLTGPTKLLDQGEQYLRLYGIVNAIYLQKSAILEFVELVKLKNKKKIVKDIESLDIFELRHIVGAHTIDYLEGGLKNPHQIQRGTLSNSSILTIDAEGNIKDYDLTNLLLAYNALAEDILLQATEKYINTVLKNGGNKHVEYTDCLNILKAKKNGDIVIFTPDGKAEIILKKAKRP